MLLSEGSGSAPCQQWASALSVVSAGNSSVLVVAIMELCGSGLPGGPG